MSCITKILKLAILLVTCCCVGLHSESLVDTVEKQYFIGGCFIAYLIIGVATLFEFSGAAWSKTQDVFFCLIGVGMFFTAGLMSITYYSDSFFEDETKKITLAKGVLALVNAVLYLVCGYLVCREKR